MFMGSNTFEPLQHLIPFERDSAFGCVSARKSRAPYGVSVQHGSRFPAVHDREMQQRLRRWLALSADDLRICVHLEKVRGRKIALVQSRGSNCQPQRLARNHRAEISTRSQNPNPSVETPSNH